MTFLIATNNPHKLLEMQRILSPLGIGTLSLKAAGVDLSGVEETGQTFEENAYIKARAAFLLSGMPVIADDSGLVVDALNGEPGVYSARYSGENATDAKNIEKLLSKMKNIPEEQRTARFVCAICCIFSQTDKIFARGECEGKIAFSTLGESGFGYDPVFIADGTRSFAQLSETEKDSISHRGKAFHQLAEMLKQKF